MRNLQVKRGATFQVTLTAANADGSAFDLTQVTVKGTVRDGRDVLVAELDVALIAEAPGSATLQITDTSSWPLGLLKADLWISDGEQQTITSTFGINVLPSVTYTTPAEAPYNPVTA